LAPIFKNQVVKKNFAVGLLDPDYGTDTFSDSVDKLLTSAHEYPEGQRPQTLQHKPEILQAAKVLIFHFLW